MSDQFDDMPPGDEEADDFKNFDPEAYLAKRGRTRNHSEDVIQREAQDMVGRGSPSGRRRRASSLEDNGSAYDAAQNVPVGLGAAIIGLLQNGNIGMTGEILRSFGPFARIALGVVGCALVAFCVVVCGGGFLLINLLSRR
jgi:hypothetical protein